MKTLKQTQEYDKLKTAYMNLWKRLYQAAVNDDKYQGVVAKVYAATSVSETIRRSRKEMEMELVGKAVEAPDEFAFKYTERNKREI